MRGFCRGVLFGSEIAFFDDGDAFAISAEINFCSFLAQVGHEAFCDFDDCFFPETIVAFVVDRLSFPVAVAKVAGDFDAATCGISVTRVVTVVPVGGLDADAQAHVATMKALFEKI